MAEPVPAPDERRGGSRRDFLKIGGAALGGLAVGGLGTYAITRSDSAPGTTPVPDSSASPAFEHVVVLMGENRSFDNLFGWLYTPQTVPAGDSFDGLAFGSHANVSSSGRRVAAHVYEGPTDEVMQAPNPDPGEEYPHVNTQLYGTVSPAANAELWKHAWEAPYNAPGADDTAELTGFVKDYEINCRRLAGGAEPSTRIVDQIMGGFSPEQLPVLSTLAREFAVFDAWFCGVPSQTYTNRSFFHASTSHGFVTNHGGAGYSKWLDADAVPTIFDRLEAAGLSWRVYFDEAQLVSLTGVLHAPSLEKYWKTNRFVTMDEFFTDARDGTLPAYAFIEPRMVYNHNDFHPPFGTVSSEDVNGAPVINSAVSDVRAGEKLVATVYDAIRTSATSGGSNAENTLFLITFDEHGGTYDHVPPPAATPPDASGAGEMGFTFDRLGLRVPAVAVSAYTKAGTIIHEQMDHGSVIATLSRLHGLLPLTERDVASNDFLSVANLSAPRPAASWPQVHPMYVPTAAQEEQLSDLKDGDEKDKPLSPPGRGLLGLLLAKYAPGSPDPKTYADAYRVLSEHGTGLFYPKTDR
ncbi:alkaline phosphatase family protein [Microbacterium gorillae]|uniref:alkaline phosphatase family protein n=1 Tax=Microbacterium gorillae TaxID=1231063 RepID=UPI0006948130|nr:alkaline phosphatase family protein [Microbacterium gorillae]